MAKVEPETSLIEVIGDVETKPTNERVNSITLACTAPPAYEHKHIERDRINARAHIRLRPSFRFSLFVPTVGLKVAKIKRAVYQVELCG